MVIPWLIANAHWIIPAAGWLSSELLPVFTKGQKVAVWQVILDFFKSLPDMIAEMIKK